MQLIVDRRWQIAGLAVLLLAALASAATLAHRTWRSYTVLDAARTLELPRAASIRGWMTVGFVATDYRVPQTELLAHLKLPPDTPGTRTLRELAQAAGLATPDYVMQVQRAIAQFSAGQPEPAAAPEATGWLTAITDRFLAALLVYGYPVLAAVLFLGAVGLPVPAGAVAVIAGALALQGKMDAGVAAALATGAAVLGDAVGYAAGRLTSPAFIERRGRWIGYTPAVRLRVERVFARWGGPTLVLTRSLVSHVAVIASLIAGAGRYPLGSFLAWSTAGRALWTAAYFGLGYVVGTDFEASSGFLGSLSLLLIALALAAGCAALLTRTLRPNPGTS